MLQVIQTLGSRQVASLDAKSKPNIIQEWQNWLKSNYWKIKKGLLVMSISDAGWWIYAIFGVLRPIKLYRHMILKFARSIFNFSIRLAAHNNKNWYRIHQYIRLFSSPAWLYHPGTRQVFTCSNVKFDEIMPAQEKSTRCKGHRYYLTN